MIRDRASVVATQVVALVVQQLRSGALHEQIADLLRDTIAEIEQQVLAETRAEDPHE